eukprot:3627512-Prorocentrum_lima.AAC.1
MENMIAHNRAVERQREKGEFTSFYSTPTPPTGNDVLGEVPVIGAFQHSLSLIHISEPTRLDVI